MSRGSGYHKQSNIGRITKFQGSFLCSVQGIDIDDHLWPRDLSHMGGSRFPMSQYEDAFKALFEGEDCKIVLYGAHKSRVHVIK